MFKEEMKLLEVILLVTLFITQIRGFELTHLN